MTAMLLTIPAACVRSCRFMPSPRQVDAAAPVLSEPVQKNGPRMRPVFMVGELPSMLPGGMAGRCRCHAWRGGRLAAAHPGVAVARMPVPRRAGLAAFHDRRDLFPVDGLVLQQRRGHRVELFD